MEPNIEIDEINLEDLIVLGEDKKIPIQIEFPKADGGVVKAKALVKQLTLKEIGDIKVNQNNIMESSLAVLEKALFKNNGKNFTEKELLVFPIGVINAISNKIMELSGVEIDENKLRDF